MRRNNEPQLNGIDYAADIKATYFPPGGDVSSLPDREDNSVIYMDISTKGGRELKTIPVTYSEPKLIGRLHFELRCDLVPIACANFLSLIVNAKGIGPDGVKYGYKGCEVHRIVKNLLFQTGDLMGAKGHCSRSIYNEGGLFADENFIFRHTGPGCISMVGRGANANGSIFQVCFCRNEDMDEKYVVFGCICDEHSLEVLSKINLYGTETGTPLEPLYISDCGIAYPVPIPSA